MLSLSGNKNSCGNVHCQLDMLTLFIFPMYNHSEKLLPLSYTSHRKPNILQHIRLLLYL